MYSKPTHPVDLSCGQVLLVFALSGKAREADNDKGVLRSTLCTNASIRTTPLRYVQVDVLLK